MILPTIAILSVAGMAFITGIKLGRLIQIKKQREVIKGLLVDMVAENVKAFDKVVEIYKKEEFWLDKQAMARSIN